jgi:hypothetical protein
MKESRTEKPNMSDNVINNNDHNKKETPTSAVVRLHKGNTNYDFHYHRLLLFRHYIFASCNVSETVAAMSLCT